MKITANNENQLNSLFLAACINGSHPTLPVAVCQLLSIATMAVQRNAGYRNRNIAVLRLQSMVKLISMVLKMTEMSDEAVKHIEIYVYHSFDFTFTTQSRDEMTTK